MHAREDANALPRVSPGAGHAHRGRQPFMGGATPAIGDVEREVPAFLPSARDAVHFKEARIDRVTRASSQLGSRLTRLY